MSAGVLLVTDGSPESAALTRWLRMRLPAVDSIEALGPLDVPRIVRAAREAESSRRVVAISNRTVEGADLDGNPAVAAVRAFTADLGPLEVRIDGSVRIEDAARSGDPRADAPLALLRRLAPVRTSAPHPKTRGRPKGSAHPFRGVGFDVSVALLREPARTFTERELAELTRRSQFGVHRVLGDLNERGFVVRDRGGTRLRSDDLLRDTLVSAWREEVGVPRKAAYFGGPPGREAGAAALDTLRAAGFDPVLAGASALPPTVGLLGGPVTVYAPLEAAEALVRAGFRAMRTGGGAVCLWPILERALVQAAVLRDGVHRTHPIVTYLDLMASTDPREHALARELAGTA